jgi:hypothetical protein
MVLGSLKLKYDVMQKRFVLVEIWEVAASRLFRGMLLKVLYLNSDILFEMVDV